MLREDNHWTCHAGAKRSIFKHRIEILHYVQDDKNGELRLVLNIAHYTINIQGTHKGCPYGIIETSFSVLTTLAFRDPQGVTFPCYLRPITARVVETSFSAFSFPLSAD